MHKYLILIPIMLLSGCGLFGKHQPQEQTLHYLCGTLPLTVKIAQQQAHFIMDGQPLTLTEQQSASGVIYSDGTYRFWSKGNSAFIERNQRIIVNDCQLQHAPAR
ncbi:MliC family protein [Pantoea sp. FN0302]|uniref:MliC family protein n=1 Tax=unclassified Pantoea TaxID=2630326 RepID=UPI003CF11528